MCWSMFGMCIRRLITLPIYHYSQSDLTPLILNSCTHRVKTSQVQIMPFSNGANHFRILILEKEIWHFENGSITHPEKLLKFDYLNK